MKHYDFYRKLHERGMDTKKLAALMRTSHSHISQMINGTRGERTWRYLAVHLMSEELALLGRNDEGDLVPRGTLSHVEQGTSMPANSGKSFKALQ